MNSKRLKGFLYLIIGALLLALTGVLIRYVGEELTVYQQVYLRNGIAIILSVAAVFISRQRFNTIKNLPIRYLPLALAFPLSVITFTFSVQSTKLATSIFALYAASLLGSLLLGRIFYNERLKGYKLVAFILAFVGVLVYVHPISWTTFGLGFVLGLVSGILDSLANLYRKYVADKVDRFVSTSLNMLIGGGIALSLSLLTNESLNAGNISLKTAGLLVLFGVVTTFMFYFVIKGFENFDLNLGTIVLSTELIFGSIFALILFSEVPRFTEAIGASIIFLAQYSLIKGSQ